jgi:hypothetical protein
MRVNLSGKQIYHYCADIWLFLSNASILRPYNYAILLVHHLHARRVQRLKYNQFILLILFTNMPHSDATLIPNPKPG